MNTTYLSYLMGAENITDAALTDLGITIQETKSNGKRAVVIPEEKLPEYMELIATHLTNGFWNEVVGTADIVFMFKFDDGSIQQYILSKETEPEVDRLAAEFNDQPVRPTANVYKWLSENQFYHDFMVEHYSSMINRK